MQPVFKLKKTYPVFFSKVEGHREYLVTEFSYVSARFTDARLSLYYDSKTFGPIHLAFSPRTLEPIAEQLDRMVSHARTPIGKGMIESLIDLEISRRTVTEWPGKRGLALIHKIMDSLEKYKFDYFAEKGMGSTNDNSKDNLPRTKAKTARTESP